MYFIGIPWDQKGYLVYVPSTRKKISSYDVIFDESFSSKRSYKSQTYAEAMAVRPAVSCIPCSTSSKEVTDDIIKLTQFEEGNLVSETHENSESNGKSGDESNDGSIIPPLLSVE